MLVDFLFKYSLALAKRELDIVTYTNGESTGGTL